MGNTLWGATPEEWALWRSLCPEHLLPTVCNPEAAVSKKSQLYRIDKTTGQLLHPAKVPSLYNRKKQIAGIRQWASLLITPAMLDSWQEGPDYGICVRTGLGLLALDCDSEDAGHHTIIEQILRDTLGCLPPCRFRENSNKCLYLLNAPFERRKSVLRLPDEDGRPAQIELLATGQQFMAAGIHPSGARIVWRCEGELCPVVVSEEQLEAIEVRLRALLPVISAQTSVSEKSSDDVADLEREVMLARVDEQTFEDLRSALWYAPVLEMAGPYSSWVDMGNRLAWFKGTEYEERARELWIEWSAAAPGGDGDAAAAKWDNDALKADRTGYQAIFKRAADNGWINPGSERMKHPVAVAEDFEDLGAVEPTNKKPWPAFVRKDKTGVIKNTIDNVTKAVARPDFCGVQVRFDQFRDEIMLAEEGDSQWVPITDPDFSRLRITLERRQFDPVSKELIRDAVLLVADENPFDSAIEWLNSVDWDGVPRVKTFFETYFGVEPSEYTSAVSLYAWTALAGRVLSPGCKADMVPVLVGEQGCGKSTGIAALSPAPDFFTEISLAERDEDLSRKMRGRLVGEISELRGLNSKEIESIKAFITRTHEVWVPKYREFATQFPRRLVMFGTTNQEEFLADETGNRRWLPLRVGKVRVDDIKRDVMQLWAEGAELYRTLGGVQFRDAERLASGVHEQHMIKDAWLEIVESWLDEPDALTGERPRTREFLRASDVLQDAIGLSPRSISRREENRIGSVLRELGYVSNRPRVNGKKVRVFERVGHPGPSLFEKGTWK